MVSETIFGIELILALRPLDFLEPYSEATPEPDIDDEIDIYRPKIISRDALIDSYRRTITTVNKFWSVWRDKYLLSLRERGNRSKKGNFSEIPLSIGRVVIVKDENIPRSHWKLARIVGLVKSKDDIIRTAQIKLGTGTITKRAIEDLSP